MNEEVKKNLSDSANDFNDIVWPVIKNWFGEGELISVQDVTDFRMAQLLDTCSGIDAWYVETTKGIRGIGSRVQWTENDHKKNYMTFTIRKELFSRGRTEYEKLCNAIDNDWLYPFWFCQAYLNERHGKLLSVAVSETREIIKYIQSENPPYIMGPDAWFYVVNWKKYQKKAPILIKIKGPLEEYCA